MNKTYKMGLDVGSTTIKVVVMDENDTIIYKEYRRHLSNIKLIMAELLKETFENGGRHYDQGLCDGLRRADDFKSGWTFPLFRRWWPGPSRLKG